MAKPIKLKSEDGVFVTYEAEFVGVKKDVEELKKDVTELKATQPFLQTMDEFPPVLQDRFREG